MSEKLTYKGLIKLLQGWDCNKSCGSSRSVFNCGDCVEAFERLLGPNFITDFELIYSSDDIIEMILERGE